LPKMPRFQAPCSFTTVRAQSLDEKPPLSSERAA
jgi:hypothetical protein